jgi:ArsR family transcriptional regulator
MGFLAGFVNLCQNRGLLDSILYFHEYGSMESQTAVTRLSALAQENRLGVFRLLVKAGKEGMAAGDIARAFDVPPNTLSAQLNVLANAGLVTSRRDGRSIIYMADYDGMSDLLLFLTEDCCQGRPEMCAPLAEVASKAACCDQPSKGKAQ